MFLGRVNMNKKQHTKLELIRIEGICHMLLSKVDEERLCDLYETVTKTSPKEIKKAIKKMPRYQLIQIIDMLGNTITSTDIDSAYEQYRYGLKPGFTLFSINNTCKAISEPLAYIKISEFLNSIHYGDEDSIKLIKAKDHLKINDSVIEFSFSYLTKHSYLTENEEPAFIYELKPCFVWIAIKDKFLAIENVPDKVLTLLRRAFTETYNAQFSNIKLTKQLIKDIFGDDKIKKGSFIKPNATNDEAEKLVISDSHFSEKQAVQNSVSGYNLTGTYLNENVGDDQPNTLGINCDKGRLYLTRNVSATVFRDWSVKIISKIILYLSDTADFTDFEVFRARNVMDLPEWQELTKPQRDQIEKIYYASYVASQNKQDSAPHQINVAELKNTCKQYFYIKMQANCNQCDEPFIPRCACGSPQLTLTKGNKLFCVDCGEVVDEISCEEGHVEKIDDATVLLQLYPTADLLRRMRKGLKQLFGIELKSSFYVDINSLTLLPEQNGDLLKATDLPELKVIADLTTNFNEYQTTLPKVQKIKEKCHHSTNIKCNSCTLTTDSICIMKLFTTHDQYRPSPHNVSEFGDVSFPVTHDGSLCQLVGIAKSATAGDSLTISSDASREMLQQVLTASHDARIGVIAVICPMRFQDQLVEELRYLAKLTQKPIVILDDEFMVRQYIEFERCSQR